MGGGEVKGRIRGVPPHHCRTCPRVSGSLRAKELPRASAAEAKRMGTALVMPTKEVKMLMPSTAASLQRAFRNPNAVVLRGGRVLGWHPWRWGGTHGGGVPTRPSALGQGVPGMRYPAAQPDCGTQVWQPAWQHLAGSNASGSQQHVWQPRNTSGTQHPKPYAQNLAPST